MKVNTRNLLAAAFAAGCWVLLVAAAKSESTAAADHATMRTACNDHGGRFELSWLYNDQGTQWGRVLSCATRAGFVACQGQVCRGHRWSAPVGATANEDANIDRGNALEFPAEPAAFADAIYRLASE